jgi:hypothetical protein
MFNNRKGGVMHTKNVLGILILTATLTGCLTLNKAPETVLLINCGAETDYTAPDGRVWKADRPYISEQWGFIGGDYILRFGQEVENTDADFVYLCERYDLSEYRIPLPNGNYIVKLHFAETYDDLYGPGERIFSVKIEGRPVLVDFDPFGETGKKFTAVIKTVPVTLTDGEINISFERNNQSPMINGIEILK